MGIPLQTILFCVPSLLAIAWQRRQGCSGAHARASVGWRLAAWPDLVLGLVLGAAPGVFLLTLGRGLFQGLADSPNIAQSYYAGWPLGLPSFLLAALREALYVALGEEALFRGLLGGWLVRRLGFAVGNTVQTLVFLLPHLLLLLVSVGLWPLLAAQFLAGWLCGWLRHRSGSILPGWVAHSLSNAFGALAFMG
ncbi:MAG: CPBP family intramembrane metalloprotease [Chloroflexi bacterium]|nr:CPBP family intramembrane metalloprotease [Chloroflexota bacterium]